ncbi:transcriptional regulator, AraC family [Rhizobium tibeticum]|uniref:Transcriptional regulator, AraC family n=1 Tax=Rhizobium tibeticum TaxID=501024 RepID=A0A1H8X6X5_9HYPH|nr:AraC family transcriptional regulator [Rhizobium tibeticum]SEI22384.1 Virulence-regulating protein VirS [Rhizobium tibeticum]SEP35447.1 transcriptional regulator, AraC family [Rhizobium tibeticum]
MTKVPSDRCKLPRPFWQSLEQLGLRPSAVLRHARLPATLHLDNSAVISTTQFFAIWNAIEALSEDPAFSIRMVSETSTANHKLAFLVASYAADFRDGMARIARFNRLCSPDRLCFEERDGKVSVTIEWPAGTEPEPPLSVDASFALLLELGRRGTGRHLRPISLELRRPNPGTDRHAIYFDCPIHFGAKRDRMVLNAPDLDLPFPGHNPELLKMLTPALANAVREMEAQATLGELVKGALKRAMASGRPDIGAVARELGLSERTLQRRITAQGATFRALLTEARQELGSQLLSDPSIDTEEVAFLLGYQDANSFYRAFREWENMTPGHWRRTMSQSAMAASNGS